MARTSCGRGARRHEWHRAVVTTEKKSTREKTKHRFVFTLFILFFSFSVFFALPASAKTVTVVGDAKKPTKSIGSHAKTTRSVESKSAEFSLGASSGNRKHHKVSEESTSLPIAAHSAGEKRSTDVNESHVDAVASSRIRPNTRKSQIDPIGAPFESILGGENLNFNSVGNPERLPLHDGEWEPWEPETYGRPNFSVSKGICVVQGVVNGGWWSWDDHIADLPPECRPEKKIIFNINNDDESSRIDVSPDGSVDWNGGGRSGYWLSLTGIKFVTKEAKDTKKSLEFLNGATNYGGVDEDAFYSKIDGECVLGGLIKKGSSWEVARLPQECRPEKTLVFNVNTWKCHNFRLSIYDDGRINGITNDCDLDSVSLSGISFIPKDSKGASVVLAPLLENGWTLGYSEAPSYTLVGGECIIQGVVERGSWGLIATLPPVCRPNEAQIFNLNNVGYAARVDVSPDGKVEYKHGREEKNWISLSGIRFITDGRATTDHLTSETNFITAEKHCHVLDGNCDVQTDPENAIYKLWSKHDNGAEDRIWTFYEKSVPFSTTVTEKTDTLNSYDGPLEFDGTEDPNNPRYVVGWFSRHSNQAEDRVFQIKYRSVKSGYSVSGCQLSPKNQLDGQYTWQQPGSDYYVFGVKSEHNNQREDRTFSFYWCEVKIAPPKVTIGNAWSQLALEEFDFDIRVSHAVCSSTSCFDDTTQVDTNVALGLKCEAYVKPANDESCTYEHASAHLPCKKWDNFFEKSKSPAELRPYLSLMDKDGKVATGEYEIWYDCFYKEKSTEMGTGWKKLHEFRVIDKCPDFLPPGYDSLSIAELLLHSAPTFLELKLADCDRVDSIKESIFRKFDTTPQDGRLDESEVLEALLQHDVDTSSLAYLISESNRFRKKGGIMLSDFMESSAQPLGCSGPKLTESSDVYFTEASYPTIDSGHAQCKADKEGVQLRWDYKLAPKEGDRQCLYTDGRLLRSFKTDDKGKSVTSFRDERPSSGVGPDAVTLHVHMSFDSGIVENLVTNSSAILQKPNEEDAYVTSDHCVTKDSDGGKCFKRTSTSSTYLELSNEKYMSKSSIMTWIKLDGDVSKDQYLWQSVGFESNFEKAFGIRGGSGKVFARLNDNAQVEGNTTMQADEWYHVAMVLNKGSGIEIFVNGALDNALKNVDNSQMDFPKYSSKVRILDAVALYDDFRIYTGIVTRLHVSSIYSCGRQQSCALLAHATPQSRRVYCMVPKYNTQESSKGFVPPCVVGLFYTGAAMDLQLRPDRKGILFSFRDTALEETSYEILRRPSDPISGPMGDYKAVVMIDTALDYCATTFSSLTFFDDEAIREPGYIWEYAVKTKFKESTVISDPRDYKTPFFALFEGGVVASGEKAIGIPNIRVCTRLMKRSEANMPLYDRKAADSNLAAYTYARQSEHLDAKKSSSAFKITDQDDTSFAKVKPNDWFTVSLARFSRISQVNVCTKQEESQFDVRVLDYPDPHDKGDMGSVCILAVDDADGTPSVFKLGSSTCRSYLCRGTSVPAYFGQSVTIKSTSSAASYEVSEVQVMGVEVDCPFTSFSDEDGNFEIEIMDMTGETPKSSHVGVLAFKTDIYDELDTLILNATSQTTPEALLIAIAVDEARFQENWESFHFLSDTEAACYLSGNKDLQEEFGHDLNKARKHYDKHGSWEGRSFKNCANSSSSSHLGLPNDINEVHIDADAGLGARPNTRKSRLASLGEGLLLDGGKSVGKDEFISYCKNQTKFSGAHFVVQEEVWAFIDRDGSGDLDENELGNVMKAMKSEYMYAVPWLVYPAVSTKHMTQFRALHQDMEKKNALFSLVPVSKAALPSSQESWQKWVDAMEKTFPTFDMDTPHDSDVSRKTSLTNMRIDGLPETKIYAVPFATFPSTKSLSLKEPIHSDEKYDFAHEEHGILKEMFESPIEVHAMQRFPDVEHLFDDGTEKVLPIKHVGAAGIELLDVTAVTVTGMVRFPSSRTQDILCGLPSATIRAYEGKKCDPKELAGGKCSPKGYKYEFEPMNYTADATGKFDISVTPGETWAFVASSEGHDLCFGGDAEDAPPCSVHHTISIELKNDEFHQNVYFELENIIGGEFLTYFDVTERQVDLGLYAGACDTPYTKYSLLITPANGCGAPIELSDAEIVGSWHLADPDNALSNVRLWPYAAMDYNIQLLQAPDVTALTEDKILHEYKGATCKKGSQNIMNYFRERDLLVQTMPLLEKSFGEVRYEYHDWFCVEPTFGNLPETSLNTPFTSIRSDEICIGSDATKHDLTKNHLIGTSNMEYSKLGSQLAPDKFVSLKVVEAHYTAPDTISYCSMFERSVNDAPTKLNLQVRIQQDIGAQGSNPCHSSNELSKDCVFTYVNATSRLLQFYSGEDKDGNSYVVTSKGAVPNLVPPHRRKFLARAERNDGWAVTNVAIERELITVASKVRGGGDDPEARYQSATEFYATAPIRGLVYTVVHDPPGGNSFASIRQGTNIDLELGLETTRAVGFDYNLEVEDTTDIGVNLDPGLDAGSGYINVEILPEFESEDSEGPVSGEVEKEDDEDEDAPLSMSATTDNGWDFHFTLDRTISSSEDPALPGRPGDTILGGGFEIVYLRVDTVDIRDNCLKVIEEVQWLPRKPTTYLLSVYHIEYKLLPELQGLVATANDKDSIMSDGEMGDKSNDEVKAIWKHRLETSIDDWQRTLEWSSPDFNPEGFFKLSEGEQKKKLTEIGTRFDATTVPFNSDDSVFGRLMVPKINDAHGAYTGKLKPDASDYTADADWKNMIGVWNSIGTASSAYTNYVMSGGLVDFLVDQVMDQLELPLMLGAGYERMQNIVTGIGSAKSFIGDGDKSRWFPDHGNWLESWEMKGDDTGKNVFTSVENDEDAVPESLFSRGMSDLAEKDMRERGKMSLDDEFFEGDAAARYVDASVFGSKASFGFGGKNEKDPKLDPISTGSEQSIYLTFSGGGHALEFSSDVTSNIDSWGYSWAFEYGGDAEEDLKLKIGLSAKEYEVDWQTKDEKSIALEHAMAWAKFGNLEVSYSLGDPDPYDKFVVAVSQDKRFGTPIFKTIGGASKCPGEPNTMWREAGLIVETASGAGVNNKFIPPGQNALFDIIITNASPFREGHIYGLQLISGSEFNGDFGGNMLDLSFTINGVNTIAPYQSLVPLHDIPSVDANGNLKHTRLSLNIAKGKFAHSYSSVGVQLVSECEWALSRDILYRSPISSSAYLEDFKWERECPKVMWDETTYNTYLNTIISKNTSPFINVTLLNPDPLNLWSADHVKGDLKKTNHLVHPNVEFVRVQWRKLGQGEWMNSWDMVGDDPDIWKRDVKDADVQCDSARGKGCAFKWNTERQHFLSGLKDGTWEVRAKVFCSGYDSFATSEVKESVTEENLNVVVDVTSPEITSVSVYNRTVTIDYSEPVICPQLTVDHMSYTIERMKTCEGDSVQSGLVPSSAVFSHYQFSCLAGQRGTIMAKWPTDAESGIYKLTVNADKQGPMVTDFALNPGSFGEQISRIAIGCNFGQNSVVKLGDTLSRNKSSVSASEAKGKEKVREVTAHAAHRESTLGAAALRSSEPIFFSFSELPVKFDSKFVVVTSIFAMMFVALSWRRAAASKATASLSDDNFELEKRSFLNGDESKRRIEGRGGDTYGAVL